MEDDDDTVATPASQPSDAHPIARDADAADGTTSGATAANTASDAPPEAAPTAQEQPIASTDEGITLAIRRALVADDSLGIRARNTTIVTRRGVVTLRGSVEDTGERSTIERHARSVEGVARVDNRIAVRP
jgi:osmotically-inducible protein OsmY